MQKKFWQKQPKLLNSILLDNNESCSKKDINHSEQFLKQIFKINNRMKKLRAFDVATGVGRITKDLLSKYFTKIDVLD